MNQIHMWNSKNGPMKIIMLCLYGILQAVSSPVTKTPYIVLPGGRPKNSATTVEITTTPEKDRRASVSIDTVVLGFIFSTTLKGKYDVEVANLKDLINPISVRATAEAKRAYENSIYQVLLEIDDDDVGSEERNRPLIYNFPPEFVRKDEIVLDQSPVTAKFKLIEIISE